MDTKNEKENFFNHRFFNQTDIPTWTIGDTWIYESSIFFEGENGSFDGCVQNLVQTVAKIVNLTQNGSIPFFVVNLSGNISGELTYGIITGDLEGVIQGELVVRVSDLAIIKTELISWGEIDTLLFTFDYGLNSTLLFQPPLENYDFPLKLEDNWEVFSQVTSQGHFHIEGLINESLSSDSFISGFMEFITIQNISVPAGTFESCHLNSPENASLSYWYSPLIKNSIKSNINMSNDTSTVNIEMNLTAYSLMNQYINITQQLMPSSSYANEYINITGEVKDMFTGDAIPNVPVFLRLPYNNQVWSSTTNDLGHYNTMIMAPFIHDYTPSCDDLGSDGIIAWTSGNHGEGYKIATLVIMGINYTFFLIEGWNLISIPTANIWTAGALGENITGCTVVCRFDASSQSYVTYVVGIPYNDFVIVDGVGYFVYVASDSSLNVTGLPISVVNVSIYSQWNLIGWCQGTATTASVLGAALQNCTVICMYDAAVGSYVTHVVDIPYNDFVITPGMGLFIYATSDSYWTGEG